MHTRLGGSSLQPHCSLHASPITSCCWRAGGECCLDVNSGAGGYQLPSSCQPSVPTASLPKMQQPLPPSQRPERVRGLPAGGTPGAESSSKDQWVLAPLDWACKTEGSNLSGGWGGFIVLQLPLPRRGQTFQLLLGSLSRGSARAGGGCLCLVLLGGPSSACTHTCLWTLQTRKKKKKPETFYILPFLEQQMKIPQTNKQTLPWPVLPPLP